MKLKTSMAALATMTAVAATPAVMAQAHGGDDQGGHGGRHGRGAVELRSTTASPLTVASFDGKVLTLSQDGKTISGRVGKSTSIRCRTADATTAKLRSHGGGDNSGSGSGRSGSGRDGGRETEAGDDNGTHAEAGDDNGTHAEPGDDNGTHAEPGDDNGDQAEPGDDNAKTTGEAGPTGAHGVNCGTAALTAGATVRKAKIHRQRWIKVEVLTKAASN